MQISIAAEYRVLISQGPMRKIENTQRIEDRAFNTGNWLPFNEREDNEATQKLGKTKGATSRGPCWRDKSQRQYYWSPQTPIIGSLSGR